jgi:hypothetical protein
MQMIESKRGSAWTPYRIVRDTPLWGLEEIRARYNDRAQRNDEPFVSRIQAAEYMAELYEEETSEVDFDLLCDYGD